MKEQEPEQSSVVWVAELFVVLFLRGSSETLVPETRLCADIPIPKIGRAVSCFFHSRMSNKKHCCANFNIFAQQIFLSCIAAQQISVLEDLSPFR